MTENVAGRHAQPAPGKLFQHSMAASALTQFAIDSDQPTRRAELSAFLGPNPDSFLAAYGRIAASATTGNRGLTSLNSGLCAPAFFLGPVWFFYRKMWLWAWGYCGLMLLLAAVPAGSQIGLGLSVAAGLIARWACLEHAARTIARLRLTRPFDDMAYFDRLARAGGVSKRAGWSSGVVFAMALALAVYQTLH